MRQIPLPAWVAFLVLAASSGARGQVPPECPAGSLACTALNAPGLAGYDDSVSDLAYRSEDREVWAMEGPILGINGLVSSRVSVFTESLQSGGPSRNVQFQEAVFGIAEIPAGQPFAGNFFVLTPGVWVDFGVIDLDLRIGIMDESLAIIADPEGAFRPVTTAAGGDAPEGFFTAMDIHPGEQEIAILDDGRIGGGAHILFLDFQYRILRGPFRIEGMATAFGGGIAYSGPETVLVIAQFRTAFEGRLAMEYNRTSGAYTGRTVVLPADPGLPPPILVGLDAGLVGAVPALFAYDALRDRIIAAPADPLDAPGPVQGLNPECAAEPDGRARLTWTNNPGYSYDQILVHENGVLVAVLDRNATEYLTPSPASGKYELCLETRSGGVPSEIRVCCEGQTGSRLPFLDTQDPMAVVLDVDPLPGVAHLILGMASEPVVDTRDEFRQLVIGSFDNRVLVLDYRGMPLPEETIFTQPSRATEVRGNLITNLAATGIALVEVEVQGQKVRLYGLLDLDGPLGDFTPGASFHLLEDTVLPGQGVPTPAGSLFGQEIASIDFTGLDGTGRFLMDWDSDKAGDLIVLDTEGIRLMKLRYFPEQNAVRAIAVVPLPMRGLTPFTARNIPMGSVSVLPGGLYLVTGGDTFDSTVNRAYVVTPMDDLGGGGLLVGQVEGLRSYSQFFNPDVLGRAMGPDRSWGLETAFFAEEGPAAEGVGAVFYNFWDFRPTPNAVFDRNLLIGLTTSAAHPDLTGERLLDLETPVGVLLPLDTDSLSPSFAGRASLINFHYHLLNPSDLVEATVGLRVLLDGVEVPELVENELVIPPGRSLYRSAEGRPEKAILLRIVNRGAGPQTVRLLVGATGLVPAIQPGPRFRRGDLNGDQRINLTDAINFLSERFQGVPGLITCMDAADVDDSGNLNLTDAIFLLSYAFQGGDPPPNPGPLDCGTDPTGDFQGTELGCVQPCP